MRGQVCFMLAELHLKKGINPLVRLFRCTALFFKTPVPFTFISPLISKLFIFV